jgi:hypothetical protein
MEIRIQNGLILMIVCFIFCCQVHLGSSMLVQIFNKFNQKKEMLSALLMRIVGGMGKEHSLPAILLLVTKQQKI